MRHSILFVAVLAALLAAGCGSSSQSKVEVATVDAATQEKEIRALIEALVLDEKPAAPEGIMYSPGVANNDENYRRRYEACQTAFRKLSEYKDAAFPFLLEHLDDQRTSVPFKNHFTGHSVGNACYWNIYFQLAEHPRDYSKYGLSRKGRDGELHDKPYWVGTPFDKAGGLEKWLQENRGLNYTEMQIKCLEWLLAGEKQIGASDADSYFLNILPLEAAILERKVKLTGIGREQLERLREIKDKKITSAIPRELLP